MTTAAARPPGQTFRVLAGRALVLLLGSGSAGVLTFIYIAIAGRLLGPSGYGDFSALIALAGFATSGFAWVTLSMSRNAAVFARDGDALAVVDLVKSTVRRVVIAATGAVPLVIVAGWFVLPLLDIESSTALYATFLIVVVNVGLGATRGALRGFERFVEYSIGMGLEGFTRLALGISLLLVMPSVTSALGGYLGASIVLFAVSWQQMRTASRELPASGAEARPAHPVGFVAVVISYSLLQTLDIVIAKLILKDAEAGFYASGAALARSATLLLAPLDALLIPSLLRHPPEEQRKTAAMIGAGVVAVGTAAAGLFWFAGEPVVRLTFGSRFSSAATMLVPLTLGSIALYLSYLAGQALVALGRDRAVVLLPSAAAALICLVAITRPGMQQLATITAAVYLATAVVMTALVWYGIPRPGDGR